MRILRSIIKKALRRRAVKLTDAPMRFPVAFRPITRLARPPIRRVPRTTLAAGFSAWLAVRTQTPELSCLERPARDLPAVRAARCDGADS